MKIAVLSGGAGGEREISLLSGRHVLQALQELGHDATLVDFGPGASEELRQLDPELVFPTLHGPLGEDGTAAAVLELLRVPYVGSGVVGSAAAMDKVLMKHAFEAVGLAMARWRSFGSRRMSCIQ